MPSREEVIELLGHDEPRLLRALGEGLKPLGFAMDKRGDGEKEGDGRRWLARHTAALRARVCGDARVKALMREEGLVGKVELVAAVADLVSLVATGISPTLIAVIIIRRGLIEFCGTEA